MKQMMAELAPDERTNNMFCKSYYAAINRSSAVIKEALKEKVATRRKEEVGAPAPEAEVLLQVIEIEEARARRINKNEDQLNEKMSSPSNDRDSRDYPWVNNAIDVNKERAKLCVVCGSSTHSHDQCDIRYKNKSTSDVPEIDLYALATLKTSLFETVWQTACSGGCLKDRSDNARARMKTRIMETRKRNEQRSAEWRKEKAASRDKDGSSDKLARGSRRGN